MSTATVVPLGNDRALIFKGDNRSLRRYEARAACSDQTQVSVEIVIIEARYGWFKDVTGRCRARSADDWTHQVERVLASEPRMWFTACF